MTLFDEHFLIRKGKKELRLWPFEPFSTRMVCQTECMRKRGNETYSPDELTSVMNLQFKLPEFSGRVGWRLDLKSQTDARYRALTSYSD
jgi:hypothetical protein